MSKHTNSAVDPLDTLAEVRAGEWVVRYRRAGQGSSLVLLLLDEDRPLPFPELLSELDGSFRVVIPCAPDEKANAACWLNAFLEGLGAYGVGIIAAGRYRTAALELAHIAPDHVARIVLVSDFDERSTLGDCTRHVAVPMVVIPRDAVPDHVPALMGFLGAREAVARA